MAPRTIGTFLTFAIVFWCAAAKAGHDDNADFPFIPFDDKAIQYEETQAGDPVARLQEKLDSGQAKLDYDPKFGYLPSVLKSLDINIDSQILVFSKTSFQAPRISPARPRVLYFNDQVSIGSVQNGQVLEVVSLDPKQGEIFYTLDAHKSDKPGFHREGIACLQCHMSPATLNVPGLVASSVYPSGDGTPYLRAGQYATDHRTPLLERWGGWYVTSTKGPSGHRGNSMARNPRMPTDLTASGELNPATLDKMFDTSPYLLNTSDIVALLTLEHQTTMTNLITRLGWETRLAATETATPRIDTEEFRKRLDLVTGNLVTYMLFADEVPLREPIQGSSTFARTFPLRGPRDARGRSLRDFDLQTRIFRYPLSYMIYSEAFDSLPVVARDAVYQKLYDVLSGRNRDETFARLGEADRRAIFEIVRDTKPNLPEFWNVSAVAK